MMYYLVAIIVFLIIGLVVSIYANYNQLTKSRQYEEIITEYAKESEKPEQLYRIILGMLQSTYSEIVRIDKRGSFSSDDEVGFAFNVIKTAIQNVTEQLKALKKDEHEETEEKK